MKYGKLLIRARRLTNPTWQEYWMDYSTLKGLIYKIKSDKEELEATTTNGVSSSSDDEETTSSSMPPPPPHPLPIAKDNSSHDSTTSTTSNQTDTTTTSTATTNLTQPPTINLGEESRTFFEKLRFELRKVSIFYNNQEQILLGRTSNFAKELHAAESQTIDANDVEQKEARVITLSRLMESCKVLYVDLMMLENFAGKTKIHFFSRYRSVCV